MNIQLERCWKKLIQINTQEPIFGLFNRMRKVRPAIAALLIGALHLGIWVAVDLIILNKYPAENQIYITDIDEFTFGFFLWGIFIPLIWWFYLSFPRLCGNTIEALHTGRLVNTQISRIVPQGPFTFVALLFAVFVGWIYGARLIQAEIESGRVSFWFATPWSKWMIVLMVAFNAYVFIAFLLNTVFFSYRISRFFSQYGVLNVQLFHADGCGGFGVVGALAMRLSSLAVLAGLWAAWYTLIPLFVGGKANIDLGVILVYLVYVILVPLLLLSLTWALHRAMKKYKLEHISQIGEKLERVYKEIASSAFDQSENNPITDESVKRYQNLLQLYEKAKTLPVWPISVPNLRKFTVFASLPGVIGFASFVVDVLAIFDVLKD